MSSKRKKNRDPIKQCHHYAKNQKIVERRIDDTVFLVHPETDTVLYLNQIATAIWSICAEPITVEEATQIVQQAFPDVPPKKIAGDVSRLFKQLAKKGYVAPCN